MTYALSRKLRLRRQRVYGPRHGQSGDAVVSAPPPAPDSTLGRREREPLPRECGWCSRIWNGSAWVPAPAGLDRHGFTTGLCGDCYHVHFGAFEHAAVAP